MRKPCYGRVQFVLCLPENKKIDLFRIPVNKGTNAGLGWTKYNISFENLGPLQLTTWYKTAMLESKSRTGTRQTKEITI